MTLSRTTLRALRQLALLAAATVAVATVATTTLSAQSTTLLRRLPRLAYPTDKLGAIGIGLADLDGDHDLDLVVGNINFSARNEILLNDDSGASKTSPRRTSQNERTSKPGASVSPTSTGMAMSTSSSASPTEPTSSTSTTEKLVSAMRRRRGCHRAPITQTPVPSRSRTSTATAIQTC